MTPTPYRRKTGIDPFPKSPSPLSADTGLPSGTVVLTQDGEKPVEQIEPGDKIITRDAGLVEVTGVSRSREMVRAISFAAGSLGHTRPKQDLVLPAAQKVLIRDWRARAMFGRAQAMVRADRLVDGEFIRDLGLQPLLLHRLHFAGSHVVYAGGLEVPGELGDEALRDAA